VGAILLYSPSSLLSESSGADASWIGVIYLVAGSLFFVALLMGWFLSTFSIRNSIDKKNKNLAVIIFIGVMAANTVMLATLFVASIMFSANMVQAPIGEKERGNVACFVDTIGTCTNCNATLLERCPEWILEDVTKILQTQLKQSATLAAIFILYAISVLRFGFVLRKHLSMYQIDYV
jgi:tellurite resistance protein TehA-like permease